MDEEERERAEQDGIRYATWGFDTRDKLKEFSPAGQEVFKAAYRKKVHEDMGMARRFEAGGGDR